MKKRWNALLAILIIAGVCIVCYHPLMRTYDTFVDDWADPSYNGPGVSPRYSGGWFEYYVDKDIPRSHLIMIRNSTNRNRTETARVYTERNWEANIGGPDYWRVTKIVYGPDIYEKVEYYVEWWIVNPTLPIEDLAWERVAELSMWDFPFREGLFNEQYNVTLYANWYGYI